MCIYISSADGLPNLPTSYAELDEKCSRTFTKFNFFDDHHIHKAYSTELQHGKKASFNSKHVILPGLMDDEKLYDLFTNQKLQIEVHDRDLSLEKLPAHDEERHEEKGSAYGIASFGK